MKCDRRWWNDGRLERAQAAYRAWRKMMPLFKARFRLRIDPDGPDFVVLPVVIVGNKEALEELVR